MTSIPPNPIQEPNYDQLYAELANYKVTLNPNPTPDLLLQQIAIVQSYRARVSQMLVEAILNRRKFKNQWLIYWDNAIPQRAEKSAEQREAAVRNEYRPFYEMFKRAEDYYTVVTQIYRDLVDTNNNLARQAHILEQEMRMTSPIDYSQTTKKAELSWDQLLEGPRE